MPHFGRILKWLTLWALGALFVLCVVGSFLGAERTERLVNEVPAVVFWMVLFALLVGCFPVHLVLFRSPGLLGMHVGSVLILVGAMLGSPTGHQVWAGWWEEEAGHARFAAGWMGIYEGQATSTVLLPQPEGVESRSPHRHSQPTADLPFKVRCVDFRVEYYEGEGPRDPAEYPPRLFLVMRGHGGQSRRMPIEWAEGETTQLGEGLGIHVERFVPHADVERDAEGRILEVTPDPESHTIAMKVQVRRGGRSLPAWIVIGEWKADQLTGHMQVAVPPGQPVPPPPPFDLVLQRNVATRVTDEGRQVLVPPKVKEYLSDIEIVEGGQVVAQATLEVNHPFHWRGYHLYQASYGHGSLATDGRFGQYTMLQVKSDRGLYLVWAGFILLVGGAVSRFWVEKALRARRTRRRLRREDIDAA